MTSPSLRADVCELCNVPVRVGHRARHEESQKHQALVEKYGRLLMPAVTSDQWNAMLWQVLNAVSPEVVHEMVLTDKEPEAPSKTAIRSKRWRAKKALMNPHGVAVGQVWKRVSNGIRMEVTAMSTTHATVTYGYRSARIRLDRFTPEYSGYKRVR